MVRSASEPPPRSVGGLQVETGAAVNPQDDSEPASPSGIGLENLAKVSSPKELQAWITHGTLDEEDEEGEVRATRVTDVSDRPTRGPRIGYGFDNWLLCGCGAYDDVNGGDSALAGLLDLKDSWVDLDKANGIDQTTNRDTALEAFRSVDINSNGWFTGEEIEVVSRALKQTEHKTSKYFTRLVGDADKISEADFATRACEMMDPQVSGYVPSKKAHRMLVEIIKIRQAFLACDRDGNGWIDTGELVTVLKALGEERVTREQVKERLESLRGKGVATSECLMAVDEVGEAEWEEEANVGMVGSINYRDFMVAVADGKRLQKSKLFCRLTISNLAALPAYLQEQSKQPSGELEKTAKAVSDSERKTGSWFANYSAGRGRKVRVRGADMYHLGKAQKRAFDWEQHKGILAAALSGVVFATAAFFMEEWYELQPSLATDDDGEGGGLMDELSVEGNILNIFTATALTFFEIGAIYLYSVHAAAMMTQCAGLKLTPPTAERNFLAASIMRAALEMGHPQDYRYGVNPRRNEWWIAKLLASALYMLKRGATKFIMKIFFKKVLFRTALKNLPLDGIDIPINAMWNMITVRSQMRDVAVITFGPSCIQFIMSSLVQPRKDTLSEITKCQLLRAVGVVVTQTGVFHPNQYLLMAYLKDELVTDEMMGMLQEAGSFSSTSSPNSSPTGIEMMEAGEAGGSNGAGSRRTQSAPPVGNDGGTSNPLRQGSFGAEEGGGKRPGRKHSIAAIKSNMLAGNLTMKEDSEQAKAAEENEKYHSMFKDLQLDSEEDFIFELSHQSVEDQMLTLQVMIFASIIDGRYNARGFKERAIMAAFQKATEFTPNLQQIRVIARHFRSGRGFYVEDLTGCTDTGGTVPKMGLLQSACWICISCWSVVSSLCCTIAPRSTPVARRDRAYSEEL